MHTLQLTAFGVGVDVECRGPFAERLHGTLSDLWSACLRDGGTAEATVDATAEHLEAVEAIIAAVSSRVTLAAIEARAGQLLMLHAAGIEAAPGRVVALVAPSGVGKTTAARTLGASYPYVTDETVAIADGGTVLPYPKPLSIGAPETAKAQLSPEAAGLSVASAPLRVAGVVVLDRHADGPSRPVIEELEALDAGAILAEQTSYLGASPHGLDRLVSAIEAVGPARRVTYREAAALAPILPALVSDAPWPAGREPDSIAPWESGWAEASKGDDGGRGGPSIGPNVHVVHRETGALLLCGTQVLRLSPLAACVIAGVQAGADAQAVAARAATIFGAPEGASARERVDATLRELHAVDGLLK